MRPKCQKLIGIKFWLQLECLIRLEEPKLWRGVSRTVASVSSVAKSAVGVAEAQDGENLSSVGVFLG